jgi:hypothetical protein
MTRVENFPGKDATVAASLMKKQKLYKIGTKSVSPLKQKHSLGLVHELSSCGPHFKNFLQL